MQSVCTYTSKRLLQKSSLLIVWTRGVVLVTRRRRILETVEKWTEVDNVYLLSALKILHIWDMDNNTESHCLLPSGNYIHLWLFFFFSYLKVFKHLKKKIHVIIFQFHSIPKLAKWYSWVKYVYRIQYSVISPMVAMKIILVK